MKQVSVSLSTYTADVSGVCSALYELGGMVVLHDPSGCNSTYNTHDEPRWYEMDSLVFISGLSQMDAIMGNDDKFIEDIVRAAKDLSPRFIALVRTPIPLMTGTDFEGIARVLEKRTKLPVFPFLTSGMHSYVSGAGMALEAVAKKLVSGSEGRKKRVCGTGTKEGKETGRKPRINILGATPLDFSVNTSLSSLKRLLEERFEIISTFAMGSTWEEISRAGEAEGNLVVSSAGLKAARVLRERFGTPYVVGLPVEHFEEPVLDCLEESCKSGVSGVAYSLAREGEGGVYIIGEAVISQSIGEAVRRHFDMPAKIICPLEAEAEIIGKNTLLFHSEEEIKEELKEAQAVIADPIYRTICPEGAKFCPLPHEAFSGRIYRKQIPDFLRIFSQFSI